MAALRPLNKPTSGPAMVSVAKGINARTVKPVKHLAGVRRVQRKYLVRKYLVRKYLLFTLISLYNVTIGKIVKFI